MKHFLTIKDYSREELIALLESARRLKDQQRAGSVHRLLEGKTLGMIFQKPSNRTRISFEVGMFQLGGHALNLLPAELQLKEREPIKDVARVISRYVDAVMMRVKQHDDLLEFAKFSTVPVINGLSDRYHPCQALADMQTIREHRGALKGLKLCFIGDGNNVCNSLVNISEKLGVRVTVCCPKGYEPESKFAEGNYAIEHDPARGVSDCDIIYTDVWTSMGQEEEQERRLKDFSGFMVTEKLLAHAKDEVLFMHCLPAHRGQEVSDEVAESKHSIIFDQAENRLHAQKAVLLQLLGKAQG
jgi:ornithine carbamoyltransferase